jgi:virginiamycin B lyase
LSIAAGPDCALWYTDAYTDSSGTGHNLIGRITTAGSITKFSLPSGSRSEYPLAITAGPDGALWFTDFADKVGRITTSGSIEMFAVPAGTFSSSEYPKTWWPLGITVGPDGDLWFTGTNRLGRITTAGNVQEFPIPGGALPNSIAVGPDGALWFTDLKGKIWRAAIGS